MEFKAQSMMKGKGECICTELDMWIYSVTGGAVRLNGYKE